MRPSHLLTLATLLLTALAGAGCAQPGEGTLTVQATDAPGNIDDFESLMVTVETIRVHAASGSSTDESEEDMEGSDGNATDDADDDASGWITFEVDPADQEFDLTQILDGNTTTLLNATLEAGRYTQIRLDVTSATGELKDGGTVEVATPNNALRIVKSFVIEDGKTTTFVADINVVKTGQGDYQIQPVIGKSKVMGPE